MWLLLCHINVWFNMVIQCYLQVLMICCMRSHNCWGLCMRTPWRAVKTMIPSMQQIKESYVERCMKRLKMLCHILPHEQSWTGCSHLVFSMIKAACFDVQLALPLLCIQAHAHPAISIAGRACNGALQDGTAERASYLLHHWPCFLQKVHLSLGCCNDEQHLIVLGCQQGLQYHCSTAIHTLEPHYGPTAH